MEKENGHCNKRPISELSAEGSRCSKQPRVLLGCCRCYCVHGFGDITLDEKEKYYLLGRQAEIEVANEIIDGDDLHGKLNEDDHGFGDINLAAHEDEKEKYYLLGKLAEIEIVNEIFYGKDDHGELNEDGCGFEDIKLVAQEDEKEKCYLLGRLAEIEAVNEIIDGERNRGLEYINLNEQQLAAYQLENEKYFLLGGLAELEVAKEIIDWRQDPNLLDGEDDDVRTDMDNRKPRIAELENEKYFLLGRLAELEIAKEIIDWMQDPNLRDEEDDDVRTDT